MRNASTLFAVVTLSSLFFSSALAAPMAWESPLVEEVSPDAVPEAVFEMPSPPSLYAQALSAPVRVLTFRKPKSFQYEFSLLVVEGKIERAFVVSTAMEGTIPILGIHRLSVPTLPTSPQLPWPWRTSNAYFDAPMYWAINIIGGYFMHSSPHYGNLGRPGSMGCIRESLPDAMEVFNAVANRYAGHASYSMIYEQVKLGAGQIGDRLLEKTLSDSGWSVQDLRNALILSRTEVALVSRGDLEFSSGVAVDAHSRPLADADSESLAAFPLCGNQDCWKLYHRKPKILHLRPRVAYRNPKIDEYRVEAAKPRPIDPFYESSLNPEPLQSAQMLNETNLKEGTILPLAKLFGSKINNRPVDHLFEVRLRVEDLNSVVELRICDEKTKQCSVAQNNFRREYRTGEIVFDLYDLNRKFWASQNLAIEVLSGDGRLNALRVRYYR